MNAPPSLKSLAASLGLSAATVSRVLSGQAARYRISAATRDRILARAETSGLVVNHLARSLRLQRTLSIGLVIPDIANPFFALLAREIERQARRHGYSVIVADSEEDPAVEAEVLALMQNRHVDGLILAPVGTSAATTLLRALAATRPCVLVDRLLPQAKLAAITSDHRHGARLAVAHLIERGHARIACVQGHPGTFANDERVAGWRAAMRRAGLATAGLLFGAGYSIAAGRDGARALLESPAQPTAALALGNLLALGVLQAAREAGRRVPEDLSLVAFDDQPWAGVMTPPLTIIDQPIADLGREALALLLERLGRRDAPPRRRTLPVRLIERGSVHDRRARPAASSPTPDPTP
ncbi:MAG: LacI family DNA-binding transcriptional regulator [Proteobacteria bacterium]|nr:LacI family DNA-binding transcriptional regulator [Pseudomonadota bacterium]